MSVDSVNPKEISPEYSLAGLMLKLKLQYFGHLMRRTHWKRPWSWGRMKVGGEGDNRGWDGWMPSLTQWTCVWASSGSWWWTGKPGVLQSMGSQSRIWLSNGIDVHWVSDGIQPSHPLLFPSPPALNLSQHQSLFQWDGSSHQVAKVLKLQPSASVLPMNI